MKLKIDRIISIATLIASLVAVFLVLKKPAPVSRPQSPAAIAANAQSFDQKMETLEAAQQRRVAPQETPGAQPVESVDGGINRGDDGVASAVDQQPNGELPASSVASQKTEVRVNSDEISAVLAQALGSVGSGGATGGLSPDSNVGSGEPVIKDQHVSFDGDVVHGQFLTTIAGKDVWVTVSGHLGSKDGYATFDPTEFKVGDLSVPVSLVNPALQKKLAEQRDRMKLPDYVGDVKVQDGQMVVQQK
jgi:hypothetical protein